jgi:hypothetical protein
VFFEVSGNELLRILAPMANNKPHDKTTIHCHGVTAHDSAKSCHRPARFGLEFGLHQGHHLGGPKAETTTPFRAFRMIAKSSGLSYVELSLESDIVDASLSLRSGPILAVAINQNNDVPWLLCALKARA